VDDSSGLGGEDLRVADCCRWDRWLQLAVAAWNSGDPGEFLVSVAKGKGPWEGRGKKGYWGVYWTKKINAQHRIKLVTSMGPVDRNSENWLYVSSPKKWSYGESE
jgi:hypothetical protein